MLGKREYRLREGRITIGIVIGIATALALLTAAENLLFVRKGFAVARDRFYWELSGWYLWAALLPLILRLVRAYPLDRTRAAKLAFVHLPAGLLFATAQFGLQLSIARLYQYFPDAFVLQIISWRVIVYLQITVVCYAIDYAQKSREQEVKASFLKTRIAELQLQALKTQLRPAFLFDTLDALSKLIERDVEEADNTIALVGDFLRMSLENSRAKEIPVRSELEFLNCYLKIEHTWLLDRLEILHNVDPQFLDALVPNLILQPIVECAIYNKKSIQGEPIHISLTIQRMNDFLKIAIQENSGIASALLPVSEDQRLRTIGERLQQIYGNDYEFEFLMTPGAGLHAALTIPLHFREERRLEVDKSTRAYESLTASGETNWVSSTGLQAPARTQNGEVSRVKKWGIGFAVWTSIIFYFIGRNLLVAWIDSRPVDWKETGWTAFAWYIWAAMTPAPIWMAKRFPLRNPGLWGKLLVHLLASVLFWVGMCVVFSFAWFLAQNEKTYLQLLWNGLRSYGFVVDMIAYWTIVAVSQAAKHYRNHQQSRIAATQLEGKLLQSQLQALHMQLHPHFLFNTLHSISELIHEDVVASRQMLQRLKRFLRLTLENSGSHQVTLEKELEFLECYLEIQQVRFQDRLTVKLVIDERTKRLLVPNLVLQPIVENAIRYGIAPRLECGTVEIRAERNNGTLQLQVRDDGPGLPSNRNVEEGLGLSNTRERLRQLYGKFHQFQLKNSPGGGLLVTLEIPARMENAEV